MVSAMASMFRTVFWAVMLLIAAMAIFSLLAVDVLRPVVVQMAEEQLLKDCDRCAIAFDSVNASMITLFQLLVMGEGIDYFMVPMMEYHWSAAVFLLIATAVVYLGISNLILSVIVDKANEARCTDSLYQAMSNKRMRNVAKKELVQMWRDADVDMDGTVTLEELQFTFDHVKKFRAYFSNMDIDLPFLEYAFAAIDDGSGECAYEELADAVVRMKNTDTGPVVSLVKLQMQQVLNGMDGISKEILSLKKDFRKNTEQTKSQLQRSTTAMAGALKRQGSMMLEHGPDEEHPHDGGHNFSTVVADMVSWFNSDSAATSSAATSPQLLRKSTTRNMSDANESGSENDSDEFDLDALDAKHRQKKIQKQTEKNMVAAATLAKELAALQSQKHEIERSLRDLNSKPFHDVVSKKARQEDAKILNEILVDLKRKESRKKSELGGVMGMAPGKKSPRSGSRSG